MNFTPKLDVRSVLGGILTLAVVGLIGWAIHVAPVPPPTVTTPDTVFAQQPFQANGDAWTVPAIQVSPAVYWAESAPPAYYQPVHHGYHRHGWWRRNAPIVGGAAGGALIGGAIGGGPGALVGGAVGGGGGYAYKRYHHHHHHRRYR